MVKPTFVIADVHGDLPCLRALLEQEGILSNPKATTVIQLGDLGHFGDSHARDREIYAWAETHLDCVLWGNHDWAAFNPGMGFSGYQAPFPETKDVMKRLRRQGRMPLAMASQGPPTWGFLLTHAGLHAAFKYQRVDEMIKTHPWNFAAWIRRCEEDGNESPDFKAVRDAIPRVRGGSATAGGILWRDASEKLYGGFRQIFGHTRSEKVRTYQGNAGTSYCLDVHSATNNRLAGIWLPEERVAEVTY